MRILNRILLHLVLAFAVIVCHTASTIAMFGSTIKLEELPVAAEEEHKTNTKMFKLYEGKLINHGSSLAETHTIAKEFLIEHSKTFFPSFWPKIATPPPDQYLNL